MNVVNNLSEVLLFKFAVIWKMLDVVWLYCMNYKDMETPVYKVLEAEKFIQNSKNQPEKQAKQLYVVCSFSFLVYFYYAIYIPIVGCILILFIV